ncbi:hypothetical protein [Geomicrobium sediminis]|uniref:Phage/plasmid-associated DNA primase n=1 Tax=Geomicrobium sediminis TaxID=1347788 RepID=A0ABS2PB94_9BACL|nr:hypothetical protein [Geomicrobium sediminis]MBM7632350.1 phage/plasmid-associated DNA primase [Geomicrobium sediminis]
MKKHPIVYTPLIGFLFLPACEGGKENSQESGTDNNLEEDQELPEDDEENNVDDEPLDVEGEDLTESDLDTEEASSDEEDAVSETVYLYYTENTEASDAQRYKEHTTIYAASKDELYWAAIHTWASDPDHKVGKFLSTGKNLMVRCL